MFELIVFEAEWCGACKIYREILERIEADVTFLDSSIDPDVKAVPLTILKKDGVEVKRKFGAMTELMLRDFLS